MKSHMPVVIGLGLIAACSSSCVHRGASTLYYGTFSPREILHVPVTGGEPTVISKGTVKRALAFDPCAERLIVGNWSNIHRREFDGTYVDNLATDARMGHMAVDLKNRHIFWTVYASAGKGEIQRCDLDDGANRTTVRKISSSGSDIAVDPKRGKLYWTRSALWQAELDGSNAKQIGPGLVYLVDVDVKGKRLFFFRSESRSRGIWTSELDGSNAQMIAPISPEMNNVRDLAVDSRAKKVYWATDERGKQPKIWRCSLDGSELELVVALGDKGHSVRAITLGYAPKEKGLRRGFAKLFGNCLQAQGQ
ncbi:MAG: hypothetical protein ACI9DF_004539 [Verrucomicrobiales bacterium]|jgi:hypothetical protein